MYAELAQYVYPKRRAIEQTIIENPLDQLTEEQILAQIQALIASQPELMQQLESMKAPAQSLPEVPLR